MGKSFYWLAVFELLRPALVNQPQAEGEQFYEPNEPLPVMQMVNEKWTKTGDVNISPGQATEQVVMGIVQGCKSEAGGVPADALLTNIVILPNRLVG